MTKKLYPNVLAISETKIDASSPNAMFTIDEYYNPADFRKDRDRNGGGLLVYIKKGTPCKRLKTYEEANIESICFEITIKSRKWFILAFYRPPNNENLHIFFNYISKCTEKAFCKYENIILLGDINIDTMEKKGSKAQLFNQFCETFDMTNLIKSNTCFTKSSKSSIDVILTNRPRLFFHSQSVETGISDVHTMVCTLMRSQINKVNPVKIQYRDYKHFNKQSFLKELSNAPLIVNKQDPDIMYNELVENFSKIVNRHAPLKHKMTRGNIADFMTKELRKAIMLRSRLKNIFNKHRSNENWKNYKMQRNLCNSMKRKAKAAYFRKLSNNPEPKDFGKQ